MAKSDRTSDTQYGALPWRHGPHGLEIMLITSRETKRWVIPKGWPMVGKKPHRVAEIEAFQEAGVKGIIAKKADRRLSISENSFRWRRTDMPDRGLSPPGDPRNPQMA